MLKGSWSIELPVVVLSTFAFDYLIDSTCMESAHPRDQACLLRMDLRVQGHLFSLLFDSNRCICDLSVLFHDDGCSSDQQHPGR
jgi:hypothetical protein